MEVYFYCSFEHSQKGFYLTRLDGDSLVPTALSELPELAETFFSYDRFQLLWRDINGGKASFLKPSIDGSFLGIRGLLGSFSDGRRGTVNMALYAADGELPWLRRIALTVLGDFDAFREFILRCLSVGGPCSYQLDVRALTQWLQACGQRTKLHLQVEKKDPAARLLPNMQLAANPMMEPELLHLAVCTCSWEKIYKSMGTPLMWLLKPRCALTTQEFETIFTGRGPVWELTEDQ